MSDKADKQMLSPCEAAAYLGLTEKIVTRNMEQRARRGLLPAVKVDRSSWVFKREELDKLIEDRSI